nr:hypothetical protein CFP56_68681 [Quercus suber]
MRDCVISTSIIPTSRRRVVHQHNIVAGYRRSVSPDQSHRLRCVVAQTMHTGPHLRECWSRFETEPSSTKERQSRLTPRSMSSVDELELRHAREDLRMTVHTPYLANS